MKKLILSIFTLVLVFTLSGFASPLEDFTSEDNNSANAEYRVSPVVLVVLINTSDVYNEEDNNNLENKQSFDKYGEMGKYKEFRNFFFSYAY